MSTIEVEMLIGDKIFPVTTDGERSILDHALSQGIRIDYACKRGDCGKCVGRLLSGNVQPIDEAKPCFVDGEIHLCNATARSKASVRMPYAPETERLRTIRAPCKINELTFITPEIAELVLRLPPQTYFDYLPGQYVRLTNREQITRSFSIAQAPEADQHLRFHIRRPEQGEFGRYLFSQARLGDLLYLEGPLGRFFLRPGTSTAKTIFLATGTGIAPIHAILSGLANTAAREHCGELHLYWGNRHRRDEYLSDSLSQLAIRLNMHYRAIFSGPGETTPGKAPHVQDFLVQHHPNLENAQVFAAGNPAMIEQARRLCASHGLLPENFHSDSFTAS